jgi:hypothetical protein
VERSHCYTAFVLPLAALTDFLALPDTAADVEGGSPPLPGGPKDRHLRPGAAEPGLRARNDCGRLEVRGAGPPAPRPVAAFGQ